MTENAIEIKDLHKSYRSGFWLAKKKSLFGISLTVKKGEIFGFIGPNGAGKSTTIKVLTGLLHKDSGSVLVWGNSPDKTESRLNLGFLPEQPYFYDSLSGYELLKFYGALSGLSGSLLEERIHWALKLVNADYDWIRNRLRTYSKGMQQRVGLAQAILHKPELLILDEPMSGLDPLGRRDVREAILALNREGSTIFYSSHVLSDVEAISNRVAMIIEGKILHEGTVEEITKEAGRNSLEDVLAKEVSYVVS